MAAATSYTDRGPSKDRRDPSGKVITGMISAPFPVVTLTGGHVQAYLVTPVAGFGESSKAAGKTRFRGHGGATSGTRNVAGGL